MKQRIGNILIISCSLVVMFFLISFSSVRYSAREVKELKIDIKGIGDIYFVDQLEVKELLNANHTDYVLGLKQGQLDLRELERRVGQNVFIKDVQVYSDVKGNLHIKITQNKPIARIILGGGKDRYIDEEGKLLPLNAKYTARVPLVSLEHNLPWKQHLHETPSGQQLHQLLSFIDQDNFWKAQIAQITVLKNGEVTMQPQVTRQEIFFGKPEDILAKFKKLKLFYYEILPNKGWNTYASVNVKFKNQIICQ